MKKKFLMTFIFLFAIICFTNVYALEIVNHGTGGHRFRFNFDDNGYPVTSVKVNGFDWVANTQEAIHEFLNEDNVYTIVIIAGKKGDLFPAISTPGGYDAYGKYDARPNPNDDKDTVGDEYIFTLTLTDYNDDANNEHEEFGVSMTNGPEPEVSYHDEETDITFSISGEELEYHYVADKPDEADVTFFKFAINSQISDDLVPFTFGNAKYTYIEGKEPPKNVSKAETKEPIHYHYRYNDSGHVEFCVNGSSTDEYTKIMINGVDYANQAPHTQREVFERFGGSSSTQFCIKNVPYAATYNVVVEGRGVTDDKKIAGFAWSYLTKDRSHDVENEGDFAHGKLEFVHAKFTDDEGQDYEFSSASSFNAGRYHGTGEIFQWANGDKEYPEENRRLAGGNVLAPYGTELTVRIVPDAGYQLTSMTTSEHGFQTTDEVGVYKISLTRENLKFNDGEFKLEPVFTKIGSEVQATSSKVKGGSITTDQTVQNGSLKLSVTDANVSDNQKTAFEEEASKSGYTVNNIVDISLYNSIYKGGQKDANGNYLSWDTEVNNLSKKANIALELQDNMAGKEVALVHEKHDGEEITGYELVNVNYNSENNTMEFEESNFSNFAIVVKDDENLPDEKEMVKVIFETRTEQEIEPVEIEKGSKVKKPEDPTQEGFIFLGWFLDEEGKEEFDFNTPIDKEIHLIARWSDKVQTYTVSDDNGNSLTFNEIKDRSYELIFVDVLPMTDEELKGLGATREEYNQIKSIALKATNKYGDLLAFYKIEINDKEDGTGITEGPFKVKIKLTNEMKKYNTFKMIYLEDDFSAGDVVELKVEGDYLVGTLPHLSAYTLVGSVNTPDVPKTGDSINTWIMILIISIISLSCSTLYFRKLIKTK